MRFIKKGGRIIPIKDKGNIIARNAGTIGLASGAALHAVKVVKSPGAKLAFGAAALGSYLTGAVGVTASRHSDSATRLIAGVAAGYYGSKAIATSIPQAKLNLAAKSIMKMKNKSAIRGMKIIKRDGNVIHMMPNWKPRPS